MLSIPWDTWVTIPGNVEYISGQNRINVAFNYGPSLLVQTIEQDFHIPVNYFVEVNFIGLQSMVDAIGGIHLDFKYPLKDALSGLNVPSAGCQIVHGGRALALVRSRHLQYEVSPGVWDDDYGSDFTRIRNQQAFFRAVIHQLNAEITNPFALNGFISAAAHNLDDRPDPDRGDVGESRGGVPQLPTRLAQGRDAADRRAVHHFGRRRRALAAARPDETMIRAFLAFGAKGHGSRSTTSTTTTSTSAAAGGAPASTSTGQVDDVGPADHGDHHRTDSDRREPDLQHPSQPYDPVPC